MLFLPVPKSKDRLFKPLGLGAGKKQDEKEEENHPHPTNQNQGENSWGKEISFVSYDRDIQTQSYRNPTFQWIEQQFLPIPTLARFH